MCFRLCGAFIPYFVCCLIVRSFSHSKRGPSSREIEKLIGKVLKANASRAFMSVNKPVAFEEFTNPSLLDPKIGILNRSDNFYGTYEAFGWVGYLQDPSLSITVD